MIRFKNIRAELVHLAIVARFIVIPWIKAYWSGRSLEHVGGPAKAVRPRGLVVVTSFYGNQDLLASFLHHHRRLGVDEFVFLDLSPEGGLWGRLAGQSDCAVWRPRGTPDLGHAIYWLNHLRWRYGTGRWCLSLDPSELFVFPRSETRHIKDLTEFLETERRNHIYAVTIEMYGDGPSAALSLGEGQHPVTALPYFDPYGYTTAGPFRFRNVLVRGGMQRRTAFLDAPRRSPALNRIPLVRWRWFYGYVAGTRLMMPSRLNTAHAPWHSSPTSCLLRFALLDGEASLATAAKVEAGEVAADGGGRSYAALSELRHRPLKQEFSMRFNGTADLVDCGLLNPGQWF